MHCAPRLGTGGSDRKIDPPTEKTKEDNQAPLFLQAEAREFCMYVCGPTKRNSDEPFIENLHNNLGFESNSIYMYVKGWFEFLHWNPYISSDLSSNRYPFLLKTVAIYGRL